jgi:hypothetical protein
MNFTDEELEELAEFVCGRVNMLNDMLATSTYEKERQGISKSIKKLQSLDEKLRPYYKART